MFEMAKILVIGIGGVGSRTVSRINNEHLEGIELIGVNADWQLLDQKAEQKNTEKLTAMVKDASMVIVICDMDGGTETEAAPIAAKLARGQGVFTVGIATKPFQIEEKERMAGMLSSLDRFKESVDALIVIPDDNLPKTVCEDTAFPETVKRSDEALFQIMQGFTDIFKSLSHGIIGLDLADIIECMKDKGIASVGIGSAKGMGRVLAAAGLALKNPLTGTAMEGASHIIINVLGNIDMMNVVDMAEYVRNAMGENANILFGASYDEAMMDEARVTVIATGFGYGT